MKLAERDVAHDLGKHQIRVWYGVVLASLRELVLANEEVKKRVGRLRDMAKVKFSRSAFSIARGSRICEQMILWQAVD